MTNPALEIRILQIVGPLCLPQMINDYQGFKVPSVIDCEDFCLLEFDSRVSYSVTLEMAASSLLSTIASAISIIALPMLPRMGHSELMVPLLEFSAFYVYIANRV